jgi:hypothetical protein
MKETEKQFLEAVEKAKQRLVAGEKPENVFDYCGNFYEGLAWVKLNGKYNYINSDCKLLSDKWFDDRWGFNNGFAQVKLNGKWNFIDHKCNYLSDTWFDDFGEFHDGFALVELNGKDYLLRKDGVLCDYGTKEPIKLDE